MVVEKVNDINFREADYFTDSDMALVLSNLELHELQNILQEWIETHSLLQTPTAARIVNAIKEFKNKED
jgi:hypothetical protein